VPPAIVALLRDATARQRPDATALTFESAMPAITAVAAPIVIPGRPARLANVDWAVLVEER